MSKILVETSARHIHVSAKDLEALFGEGTQLTVRRELSQPGQYVCAERLTIVGPRGELEGVSILGPIRNDTQVEISLTDARKIGVEALIRESGVLDGTAGCKLVGPKGEISLEKGAIAAKRHIHLTPEDAAAFGVADKQIVCVKIDTDGRSLIFGDVVARVNATYATAMHIDTDESNAAGIAGEVMGAVAP